MISLNALISMEKAAMLRSRMRISHHGFQFHHVDFLVLSGAGSYNRTH
ncbi:hypothetical protein [Burkholderia plantarii]|nr:hypothetical protein [Burkholderia plantarii]MBI0326314.1 hypothetical protein [Burkholderia plantarii]